MKELYLKESVYELAEKYPELIDILKEAGFLGVGNAVTRKTLGRATTIPQGCKKPGIHINDVIEKLKEKGFEIETQESIL
jgi:hypothetical protein